MLEFLKLHIFNIIFQFKNLSVLVYTEKNLVKTSSLLFINLIYF